MSESEPTDEDQEDVISDSLVPEMDEHLAQPTPELKRRIDELLHCNLGFRRSAEKVREFPQSPGVYLMKDSSGIVIYIGKAKNLRSRAGSYFLAAAAQEIRTAEWIHEIADIDFMLCSSEVDALQDVPLLDDHHTRGFPSR